HNLAKVGVEGSNPFARSSFLQEIQVWQAPQGRFLLPRPHSRKRGSRWRHFVSCAAQHRHDSPVVPLERKQARQAHPSPMFEDASGTSRTILAPLRDIQSLPLFKRTYRTSCTN